MKLIIEDDKGQIISQEYFGHIEEINERPRDVKFDEYGEITVRMKYNRKNVYT